LKKNYYTSPASLNALLNILVSDQETKLRQLAAVEARKLVTKHWSSVPADQKPGIRNQLLQSTLAEEQTLIRHSAARVITAIASLDLEDGEWADLPSLLSNASTSNSARHREVGVYILYCLMETSPELFEKDMANMFGLFSKTVEDPESSEVRANTMLALGRIATVIDSQEDDSLIEPFQALVPKMVAVLREAINNDDEVQAMKAFEVFQMLLQCDSALLAKHFRDLLNFMTELGCQTDLDDDYRTSALAFLTNAVRTRKMKVQGLKIGGEIAEKALSIVPEMGDMPTEEEEIVPATSALALLDIMASSLPPSQVVVPLLNKIGPFITNESADYRRGGLLALSMLVEGAPDFFSTQLDQILPMLLQLLQAPEAKVRSAALKCLSRLADDLANEMANQHASLIPAVIHSMDMGINAQNPEDEWNLELIRHSCVALDALVDGLEKPDAAKYVSELVPRLKKLFQHSNIRVQHGAICAIGSLAAAAGDAFLPHFQEIMQALGSYVTLKGTTEEIDLRATACDAIGRIAGSAGPENFNPFVRPLMESSEEALGLENSHLREMTYVLWAALAKVYGTEFAPYLQGVVTGLHDCLKQKEDMDLEDLENLEDLEGKEISLGGHKLKIVANDDDDDEDGEMNDGDGDGDDWEDIAGITGIAMEKEMAIESLGDIISHTKEKYLPYLESTIELLGGLVDHDYEGVRRTAIGTMWRAYATAWGIAEANGMAKWKPGFPVQVQPAEDITKLGNAAMSMTLQVWSNEEDM
jgi:importin-4